MVKVIWQPAISGHVGIPIMQSDRQLAVRAYLHYSVTFALLSNISVAQWHLLCSLTFALLSGISVAQWHLHYSVTLALLSDISIAQWH